MMKRILTSLLALAIVLGGASTVLAQEEREPKVRDERAGQGMKNPIKTAQSKLRGENASSSKPLPKVAPNLVERASRLYMATIDRLERIADRVNSRIVKVRLAGGSTTEAEVKISAAQKNLADARAELAILKSINLSATSTSASTQNMNLEKARVSAQKIKGLLKEAKTNIAKALSSLNMSAKSGKNATTTATSTNSGGGAQ